MKIEQERDELKRELILLRSDDSKAQKADKMIEFYKDEVNRVKDELKVLQIAYEELKEVNQASIKAKEKMQFELQMSEKKNEALSEELDTLHQQQEQASISNSEMNALKKTI